MLMTRSPYRRPPVWWHAVRMKTRIQCPCGETIVGKDEDELVELTNAHLTEQHDGRTYNRDMILMMAT
jgi:predicted small metal-binding protein